MTEIISIEEFKKEKEKKKWEDIILQFEETLEREADRKLNTVEQKGYNNLKRLAQKLREKHLSGNDDGNTED